MIHLKRNIAIGKEDPKLTVKLASLELTLDKIKKGRESYLNTYDFNVRQNNLAQENLKARFAARIYILLYFTKCFQLKENYFIETVERKVANRQCSTSNDF